MTADAATTPPLDTTGRGTSKGTSPPLMAKGTTCAFTTTNPCYAQIPTTNNQPQLDETMAQAVETLQIDTNATTTGLPTTTTTPWMLVTKAANNTKPTSSIPNSNSHEFGLAFERTTKGNNWATDDLLLILQTLQAHDPKAMLSSADNKTKPTLVTTILHKAQKDIPWFTKFTAMKTMTWGKPSDGTTKIVFSFWLTSTIIKKDLAQLRMDSDFTEMLKGTNTYMKVTNALR